MPRNVANGIPNITTELEDDLLETIRQESKTQQEMNSVSFFQAQVAEVYPSGGVNLMRLHNVDDDDIIEPDDEETVRLDPSQELVVGDYVWCLNHVGNAFVVGKVAEEGHLTLQELQRQMNDLMSGKISVVDGSVVVSQIVPEEDGRGRLDKRINVGTNQIVKEGAGLDGAFLMERSINDTKIAPHSIDFRRRLKNVPQFALREYVRNSFAAIRARVTRNEESIDLLKRRVRVLENKVD